VNSLPNDPSSGWRLSSARRVAVPALALLLAAASPAPRAPDPRLDAAERLIRQGGYAKALALTEAVLSEARGSGDLSLESMARLRLADLHFYQDRPRDYEAECTRALAAAERAGDDGAAAQALYYLSYVHERGRPTRMVEILREARARAERSGDLAVQMRIHNAIGSAAWSLGRYAEAHDSFALAERIALARGDENNAAVAASNLGLVDESRGDYESAQERLAAALLLLEKHGNARVASGALGGLASVRGALGDLEGALALHQRALGRYREIRHSRGETAQLQGIASIERDLGRPQRAEGLLLEALRIATASEDERRSILLLQDLGELLVDRGRIDKALPHLEDALRRAEAVGDPQLVARACLALASCERAAARPAAALVFADRARTAAAGIGDRWSEGQAWSARAEALEALGRPAEALDAWRRAITRHESARALRHLHVWYGRLARLAVGQGDPAGGEAAWRQSLSLTERLEGLVALDRFRTNLFAEVQEVFHAYGGWLADQGRTLEAFAVIEQGRARDLRLKLAQAGGAPLSTAERDALARVSALGRELLQTSGRAERVRLEAALSEAEAEHDRARLEASSSAPVAVVADAEGGRDLPGVLLLGYALDGDRLLVFSMRGAGRPGFRAVPQATALLERVRRFSEAAASAGGFAAHAEARALYDTLVGPELAAGPERRVVVVPDGDLHGLPFAALRTPEGEWLAERVVLSQAPSARTLAALRRRAPDRSQRVLAIAETRAGAAELRAASHEAREVARGRGSLALVDPGEARVKAARFADYDVVHFASHAEISATHPERSGLSLAAEAGEDGLLQAREIYGLRMPVELVVVSSCRSAGGAAVRGEGLAGLPHAFLAAGARAVVATQWDVTDEGSHAAMAAFYDRLGSATAAEALALTQRALLRSARWAEPIHWAGYVLIGDGEQAGLVAPRRWPLLGVGLSALMLAAFVVAIRALRSRARA
jgi:tetratricopeptide (TPR) repeat protein